MIARRAGFALAFALALLVALTACGKRRGQHCNGRESFCTGTKSALVCRNEALAESACGGPLGCRPDGARDWCDDTIGEVGASCPDDRTFACTADKSVALRCTAGKLRTYASCRGTRGCNVVAGALSCDESRAAIGEPCVTVDARACTPDGHTMVACNGGVWKVIRWCRGDRGCHLEGDAPVCDESIARAGDECGVSGRLACSEDGRAQLVCAGGQFVLSKACEEERCALAGSGHGLKCR